MADLPGRIDRSTFDRVLQRAAELQAASKDIGEGLSEEEILALGTEVGIPTQHLQQALIEERTRVMLPEPSGFLDHWVGRADFVAQRVVQGSAEAIGDALTRWLSRNEHLIVQRSAGNRITYEQMPSLAGAMRRIGAAFESRSKPYLDRADLVTAVITPLESGFCHVTLAASLRRSRRSYVIGGAGAAVVGTGMGLPLLVFFPAWPVVVGLAVVASAVGVAIARVFRGGSQRAQLGLERALDELERRPALPGERAKLPAGNLARGVGQVVRDITQEVRKALEE